MRIYTPEALVHYLYLPRAQRRRPNMMPLEHHLLAALLTHPIEDHHPKILRLIANHYRLSHSLLLCSDLFCKKKLKLPFVFLNVFIRINRNHSRIRSYLDIQECHTGNVLDYFLETWTWNTVELLLYHLFGCIWKVTLYLYLDNWKINKS